MIRKIYTLLILGLCLGFAACGDDNDLVEGVTFTTVSLQSNFCCHV